MPNAAKPSAYQELQRQHRPREAPKKTIEEQLDSLLQLHEERVNKPVEPEQDAKASALDRIRRQFREELLPAYEDLRKKYATQKIDLFMDAEDFLNGGVKVDIDVTFEVFGLKLEGTVTPSGIAFHETRFSNNIRGVVTAGPMLRARNLSGHTFREFVCERISQLVHSAMRRQQAKRVK